MFGLSTGHLLILLLVILLFGRNRLPDLGTGLGAGARALRKSLKKKAD